MKKISMEPLHIDKYILGIILILGCNFKIHAKCDTKELISSENKLKLIELYTSEGCSSCPPAERIVNSFKDNKNLWKTFNPMAFHVDYWDYIGWKDVLAKKEYSERQRKYFNKWNKDTVYTPNFIINGKEHNSFKISTEGYGKKVGVIKAIKEKNKYHVSFKPIYLNKKDHYIHWAILRNGITHKVKKGENRGKTLKHNFVVTMLGNMKMSLKKDIYKSTLSIPKLGFEDKSIVLWITEKDFYNPIQSIGGCV